MVDEYLSEREQADQLRHWLRSNWLWLVAGVAFTLGGFYGWRWWDARQLERSAQAETRFAAMVEALASDKRDEGLRLAGELTGEYADTPYAEQATLVLARLDVEAGEFAKARERLAGVMEDARDPELRLVARLRLARVQLAEGAHDAALATLAGAEEPSIEARVAELRGDVLLAKGDRAGALEAYGRARSAAESAGVGDALVDTELLGIKIDQLAATAATE